jgi:tetratricopeptide (TPR) repeat protein
MGLADRLSRRKRGLEERLEGVDDAEALRAQAARPNRSARKAIEHAGEQRRAGDAAEAVEQLAPLLLEYPDDPQANVEMSRALQLLGDNIGAEEHYRRTLKMTLDYRVVVELSGVVGAQGRSAEAWELLDAAHQMAEKDSSLDAGEVHLMRAMLAVGSGDETAAREALEKLDGARTSDANRAYGRRLASKLSP